MSRLDCWLDEEVAKGKAEGWLDDVSVEGYRADMANSLQGQALTLQDAFIELWENIKKSIRPKGSDA